MLTKSISSAWFEMKPIFFRHSWFVQQPYSTSYSSSIISRPTARDRCSSDLRLIEEDQDIRFSVSAYYQSEISNCLARYAFQQGADWVFFLDADEFIDIDDRETLEALVKTFPHEVMHLPWMNLVPTEPGSFTGFDASQAFRWDGRLSRYGKIAINATFAAQNPHFFVHQGNHTVFAFAFASTCYDA